MTRTLVVLCADWPIRAARDLLDHGGNGTVDGDRSGDPRPVAVWSHRGIVAADPAARAAGVRVGLRRREAQGRCPELELIPADPARDARCFDPVMAALGAFTPQVEIVEPGCAALATRGPSRYFGGDEALADRILRAVEEVLTPSGGSTVRSGSDDPGPSPVRVGVADGPFIAHLAALGAAPGHAHIVAPGDTASFVAPIPVTALTRLVDDPDVLVTWRRLGLRTLGQVAALPTAAVAGRFGTAGLRLHRLARGDDPTASAPTPIPTDVDATVDFDPPEHRADAVAFTARAAADDFVDRLGRLGLSCAQVVVTLSTDHAEECRRRWRLDGPARSAEGTRPTAVLVAERVRWQTDGWLSGPAGKRPSAGIVRMVLSPGEVRAAHGTQAGFWGGASANDQRAAHAIARLEALAGPDAVCVVEPRGGRDPTDDAALVPTAGIDLTSRGRTSPPGVLRAGPGDPRAAVTATGARTAVNDHRRTPEPPWPGRLPSPSPTLVVGRPHPIGITDADGVAVEVDGRGEPDRAPALVHFTDDPRRPGRDAPVAITAWAGPWPVEERWWDPERHRRHARLQLVTADGAALLVVRRNRRWWLTARYR